MKSKHSKQIQILIFILVLIWCVGILWEIIIHYFPSVIILLPFLKYNYSIVCHTDPDKLLSLGQITTLTCSRCTGIYFGGLFSSLILLLGFVKKINLKFLLFCSVPMFIDVILYSIGLYSYSHIIALLTGLLLGSVGIIYIQSVIIELLTNDVGKN